MGVLGFNSHGNRVYCYSIATCKAGKSLELIRSDKKKFCLIHSKEINHDKGSYANKRVLKVLNKVDKIVSNSEFTKNLAINVGVKPDKITVINPGVDKVKILNTKIKVESNYSSNIF